MPTQSVTGPLRPASDETLIPRSRRNGHGAPDRERWQLTDDGAQSYERFQVPSVFDPLARILLDHVTVAPSARVLDVACGTGILTRHIAPTLDAEGSILGIDLNPVMLAVARQRAPSSDARVSWQHGDATAIPVADSAFDVVLCQQGLQFFTDWPGALREMHRALVPGGTLALSVWDSLENCPCVAATVAALERHIDAPTAARLRAPCALGDPETLLGLIERAGFAEVEISTATITRRMLPAQQSIPGHLASTPVGPDVARLDASTRQALIDDIAGALAAYETPTGLEVPQATLIATAKTERSAP